MIKTNYSCTTGSGNTAGTPETDACYLCGDGVITSNVGEVCDVGSTALEGCDSNTCQLKQKYRCSTGSGNTAGTPETDACFLCGDGVVSSNVGEECDVGTTGTDGCDSHTCLVKTGWQCTSGSGNTAGTPETDACYFCGDGVVTSSVGEECDVGSTGTAGCDTTSCVELVTYNCERNGGSTPTDPEIFE